QNSQNSLNSQNSQNSLNSQNSQNSLNSQNGQEEECSIFILRKNAFYFTYPINKIKHENYDMYKVKYKILTKITDKNVKMFLKFLKTSYNMNTSHIDHIFSKKTIYQIMSSIKKEVLTKTDISVHHLTRHDPTRNDLTQHDPFRNDPSRNDPPRNDLARHNPTTQEQLFINFVDYWNNIKEEKKQKTENNPNLICLIGKNTANVKLTTNDSFATDLAILDKSKIDIQELNYIHNFSLQHDLQNNKNILNIINTINTINTINIINIINIINKIYFSQKVDEKIM
ncbi:conserved protein, unknown function, partial [Hepatocystis sp. ex Piliocolobus tephrosceles]